MTRHRWEWWLYREIVHFDQHQCCVTTRRDSPYLNWIKQCKVMWMKGKCDQTWLWFRISCSEMGREGGKTSSSSSSSRIGSSNSSSSCSLSISWSVSSNMTWNYMKGAQSACGQCTDWMDIRVWLKISQAYEYAPYLTKSWKSHSGEHAGDWD